MKLFLAVNPKVREEGNFLNELAGAFTKAGHTVPETMRAGSYPEFLSKFGSMLESSDPVNVVLFDEGLVPPGRLTQVRARLSALTTGKPFITLKILITKEGVKNGTKWYVDEIVRLAKTA